MARKTARRHRHNAIALREFSHPRADANHSPYTFATEGARIAWIKIESIQYVAKIKSAGFNSDFDFAKFRRPTNSGDGFKSVYGALLPGYQLVAIFDQRYDAFLWLCVPDEPCHQPLTTPQCHLIFCSILTEFSSQCRNLITIDGRIEINSDVPKFRMLECS